MAQDSKLPWHRLRCWLQPVKEYQPPAGRADHTSGGGKVLMREVSADTVMVDVAAASTGQQPRDSASEPPAQRAQGHSQEHQPEQLKQASASWDLRDITGVISDLWSDCVVVLLCAAFVLHQRIIKHRRASSGLSHQLMRLLAAGGAVQALVFNVLDRTSSSAAAVAVHE
jgi:hypothetical protein